VRSSLAKIQARRDALTSLLQKEGYSSVAELSRNFGVSEATIRRDLDALQAQNRLTRTYGGALSEYDALFVPFYQRNAQHRSLKRRIADSAVQSIEDASSVFLDAGSTVFTIAERIAELNLKSLRLVTNSLPAAEILGSQGSSEVHLLGGRLLPHQLVVVGPGAAISLSCWHFDLAFLSAEGMDSDGLWNSQEEISSFQRHICGRSGKSVFCLDESKLGRRAPSFLMPWQMVEKLVTTATYEQLAAGGIKIEREQYKYA